MSRVGLQTIKIEEGVTVTYNNKTVTVKGPKGELSVTLPWCLDFTQKDLECNVIRKNEEIETKALHGTFRMIIANNIKGVKEEFKKTLQLVGVGYRCRMEGSVLVMNLGLNHPVKVETPAGINMTSPDESTIIITGVDKQKVGEFAAKIREIKKPEPYKGKGIRYEGEYVRKKSSKSGAGAKK